MAPQAANYGYQINQPAQLRQMADYCVRHARAINDKDHADRIVENWHRSTPFERRYLANIACRCKYSPDNRMMIHYAEDAAWEQRFTHQEDAERSRVQYDLPEDLDLHNQMEALWLAKQNRNQPQPAPQSPPHTLTSEPARQADSKLPSPSPTRAIIATFWPPLLG